jgi:predicted nucleotidyltransferase
VIVAEVRGTEAEDRLHAREMLEQRDNLSPESRYLAQIRAILADALNGKSCSVYLFGSRATGVHTQISDFDIAVEAAEDVSRELSVAREKLELSNIPFKVDLVDLRDTSKAFARLVHAEGILLWRN